jgi:hypothetical protein
MSLLIFRHSFSSRVKENVAQADSRIDVQTEIVIVSEFFLAVRVRANNVHILSVTQDQVASRVAPVDALVIAEAAAVNFRAVGEVPHLQELHHTAHACKPKWTIYKKAADKCEPR